MSEHKEQEAPIVHWRIDEWFPDLSSDIRTRLKTYHEELIVFNRTINIVSGKTLFAADALHFADSILSSRIIMNANTAIDEITDIGSGGGFPGLVMAILYPKLKVNLLDLDQKKCEFLNHMVSKLGLKNVTVSNKTLESLGESSLKYAVVRGFSTISRTILAARKPMVKGGALYHVKGEEWGMEVTEIPTQLCSTWLPSLVGEYKLPVGAMKFSVVKTDKIA